ncbi:MAG: SMI1/KNR4 family protein, partial [Sandaracinaceae bacterium]|nr:SMI1/KNR4 family protein [Sandaracinaceae bacterium]
KARVEAEAELDEEEAAEEDSDAEDEDDDYPVKQQAWLPGWIPVTTDGDGYSLMVDLDPGAGGQAGQVISVNDEGGVRLLEGPDFLTWLSDVAWYSGNPYELFTFVNRATGPYWWAYWIMVSCNVLSPQLFWFKKIRTNPLIIFILTIFVNIGMWFERFVIIVTSLHRDFLPSSWAYYTPTKVEFAILIGSFGMFFTLFLLFVRFFPVVAIAEVKAVRLFARGHGHGHSVKTAHAAAPAHHEEDDEDEDDEDEDDGGKRCRPA